VCLIIFAAIFLYDMCVITGHFETVKYTIVTVSKDRRVLTLLLAYCFSSFIEGATGFSTPVALSAALLIGIGVAPLKAARAALLGNTVAVTFGGVGIAVSTLASVTTLDATVLGIAITRLLIPVALVMPFMVVIGGSDSVREALGIWPACLVAGVTHCGSMLIIAQFLGLQTVSILGGLITVIVTAIFVGVVWKPRHIVMTAEMEAQEAAMKSELAARALTDGKSVTSEGAEEGDAHPLTPGGAAPKGKAQDPLAAVLRRHLSLRMERRHPLRSETGSWGADHRSHSPASPADAAAASPEPSGSTPLAGSLTPAGSAPALPSPAASAAALAIRAPRQGDLEAGPPSSASSAAAGGSGGRSGIRVVISHTPKPGPHHDIARTAAQSEGGGEEGGVHGGPSHAERGALHPRVLLLRRVQMDEGARRKLDSSNVVTALLPTTAEHPFLWPARARGVFRASRTSGSAAASIELTSASASASLSAAASASTAASPPNDAVIASARKAGKTGAGGEGAGGEGASDADAIKTPLVEADGRAAGDEEEAGRVTAVGSAAPGADGVCYPSAGGPDSSAADVAAMEVIAADTAAARAPSAAAAPAPPASAAAAAHVDGHAKEAAGPQAEVTVHYDALHPPSRREMLVAWAPWALVCVAVVIWGISPVKAGLSAATILVPMTGLHNQVYKPDPMGGPHGHIVPSLWTLDLVAATGICLFICCFITSCIFQLRPLKTASILWRSFRRMSMSFVTIMVLISFGYVIKFSGQDTTLGLAIAEVQKAYPFVGPWIGFLGVALTGSITTSNVLFGSMQTVAADKIGLNPVQMAAANETAGCIGHIISTASMVVAAVAVGGDGKSITHIVKTMLPFGLGVGVMFALWNTLVAYAFPDFIPTSPYGG